jgi:2-dehydropantoate 2-reductase
MTVNPISALTGAMTDLILASGARFVSRRHAGEATFIGARIGIPIDQQPDDRRRDANWGTQDPMLQDGCGKLVGARCARFSCARAGAALGAATPFTDALLGPSQLQATPGLYPKQAALSTASRKE